MILAITRCTGEASVIVFLSSLSDVSVLKNVVNDKQLNSELLDFSGDWLRVGLTWLENLVSKALGKRINMLTTWPIHFPEVSC